MTAARYQVPGRLAAIASVTDYAPGDFVSVFAEELMKYGPTRNEFAFDATVLKLDTLPGSDQLTGRLLVETTVDCHYQKTATRNGTKTYRTAPGKRRTLAVWPWDIRRPT